MARQIRSSLYRRNQPYPFHIKLYFGRRKSPTVYHCRALIPTLLKNGFYYADYSFLIFGKTFPFVEREKPNLKVVFINILFHFLPFSCKFLAIYSKLPILLFFHTTNRKRRVTRKVLKVWSVYNGSIDSPIGRTIFFVMSKH